MANSWILEADYLGWDPGSPVCQLWDAGQVI